MSVTSFPPQETPDELPQGVVTDEGIKHLIERQQLFYPDSLPYNWHDSIRHASYQLRLNRRYKIADFSGEIPEWRDRLADQGKIHIPAGGSVQLFPVEKFRLPADIVCRVNPVGRLFLMGLSVEITYADPGFENSLHLVAFNQTPRGIDLDAESDLPLARVEFVKLPRPVAHPHSGEPNYDAIGKITPHLKEEFDSANRPHLIEDLRLFRNDERYDRRHDMLGILVSEYEHQKFTIAYLTMALLVTAAAAGFACVAAVFDLDAVIKWVLGITLPLLASLPTLLSTNLRSAARNAMRTIFSR